MICTWSTMDPGKPSFGMDTCPFSPSPTDLSVDSGLAITVTVPGVVGNRQVLAEMLTQLPCLVSTSPHSNSEAKHLSLSLLNYVDLDKSANFSECRFLIYL